MRVLRCDITDHYATILITPVLNNNYHHFNNNCKPCKVNTNHLDLLIKTEDWYSCLECENWLKFLIQK